MFTWSLKQGARVQKYCCRRSPMRQGDPGGAFTSGEVLDIKEVCQKHPFHILCYYWLLKTLSLLYIWGLFSIPFRSLEHFVITMNVFLRLLLVLWLYFSQSAASTISFALSFNLSQVRTYSTKTKTKTKTKIQTQTKQPPTKTKTKVQYNVGWSKFMKSYSAFAQSGHIFCLQGLLHGSRRENFTRLHHSHYLPKVKPLLLFHQTSPSSNVHPCSSLEALSSTLGNGIPWATLLTNGCVLTVH